ncbi:MAG: cytochrome ubiquinol oxidase subunit I [Sedimentisphaerales bacterium]|nr:cytochrome ubiquinol oxidase subunit I [Sedimentisphaerales bacterium]
MDTLLLSRIQFAVTIGFHFLFPPISIGLAWLLVGIEWRGWQASDEVYQRLGRFFARLLGLTFVMGVVTGIVMEFQFGTNWAQYSKFVGDIFGAPLAAEVVFAFFLESGFLGLYLFGGEKVGPRLRWFACLMVAVGATISAFWIIVAGSWMQTPAGYIINKELGRAELASFMEAVFNPSMGYRFFHTMTACLVSGAFFMAGIGAALVRKDNQNTVGREALKIALMVGFVFSILVAFPSGHEHAIQVARDQPEKFAAQEGLLQTQTKAPLVAFGLMKPGTTEYIVKFDVPVPGLLSLIAYGDTKAEVKGLDAFEEDELPPVWLTFMSFHTMVMLGGLFIMLTGLGVWKLWRGTLWQSRWYLTLLMIAVPLPLIAMQLGWVAAEVGRQPWIVYKLMRTSEAFSTTVPAGQVLFSLILFSVIYALLLGLYIYLLVRMVKSSSSILLETK